MRSWPSWQMYEKDCLVDRRRRRRQCNTTCNSNSSPWMTKKKPIPHDGVKKIITTTTTTTQRIGFLAVLGFVVLVVVVVVVVVMGITLWNNRVISQHLYHPERTILRHDSSSPRLRMLPSNAKELVPHVIFENNLKYRRVCANAAYETILCMILRFPFDVPLQNPNVTYPSPVDDRFYNLTKSILLDGDVLEDCRRQRQRQSNNNQESLSIHVYNCLEREAQRQANDTIVLALFTRSSSSLSSSATGDDADTTTKMMSDADFYGTKSPVQRKRLHTFYRDHDILIVGDSMAPFVAHALAKQLDTCRALPQELIPFGWMKKVVYNCSSVDVVVKKCSSSSLDASCHLVEQQNDNKNISTITLQSLWHQPEVIEWEPKWSSMIHTMNGTKTFIEQFTTRTLFLRPEIITTQGQEPQQQPQRRRRRRRPLAIILEFPFAWVQSHGMIVYDYSQIEYNQQTMIQMMMNVTSPEVRRELQELGFDLTSVMALDGFPQHFPSETGAYFGLRRHNNETTMLGYDGWNPTTLGTTCRGPLPPWSALKRINDVNRQLFSQYGMDMKNYANTWEFTNQFWWEEAQWTNEAGLDCTHPRSKDSGAFQVITYFLQNMIDGYYDSQQRNKGREETHN